MSHISQEARARAAETKRRRTAQKLALACDYLMRQEIGPGRGSLTTVEAIAAQAGVSVATFYSLYRTRNGLCDDTFEYLVLDPLEEIGLHGSFEQRARAIAKAFEGRGNLIRAALTYRLEVGGGYLGVPVGTIVDVDGHKAIKVRYDGHMVDRVGVLLADTELLEQAQEHEPQFMLALYMAALWLLDGLATSLKADEDMDYGLLVRVFMQGCMPS